MPGKIPKHPNLVYDYRYVQILSMITNMYRNNHNVAWQRIVSCF